MIVRSFLPVSAMPHFSPDPSSSRTKRLIQLSTLVAAVAVAGCGGGGESEASTPAPMPGTPSAPTPTPPTPPAPPASTPPAAGGETPSPVPTPPASGASDPAGTPAPPAQGGTPAAPAPPTTPGTPSVPAPPPVAKPASPEEAVRFLQQAAWGATDAEVASLMSSGYEAWFEEQAAKRPASHRSMWEAQNDAIKAADATKTAGQGEVLNSFWRQVAVGDDQLRQRVAFALSQIFVVSSQDSGVADNPRGVAAYLDMLAERGLGNYRDLIEAVTRHPMMGLYLSHLRNQKEDTRTGRIPDQNYAREVMQLFSIGVYKLNQDGSVVTSGGAAQESYTPDDIAGLSRVFTGFSFAGPDTDNNRFFGYAGYQDPDRTWLPMQGYSQYHSVSEKSFLGVVIGAQSRADPEASLKVALDTIATHPNVGPFIGRQLIQRLVTSNPSPAYIARVAAVFNNNGQGVRGDMKAVVKAVLLDAEARDLGMVDTSSFSPAPGAAVNARANQFGRVREPIMRFATVLHTFKATSDSGNYRIGTTDDAGSQLGQSALRAGSVFNFYRPGYVPPLTAVGAAGLVAPEMQILNETSVAGYVNFIRGAVNGGTGFYNTTTSLSDVRMNYGPELALAADEVALVARINRMLAYGQLSPSLRATIVDAVKSVTIPTLKADGSNQAAVDSAKRQRVVIAVFLAAISPEFVVQR